MNAAPIRVMLVDDHAVVRAGFRRLLEQEPAIRVVAEADTGERGYAQYLEHTPDVVVLDLSMPGVSGFEIIRRIIERRPDSKILVFSMHEDASLAVRAIQLGARGYVTKSNAPEVLATAVAEVAAGKLYVSDDVAKSIAILKLTGDDNPVKVLSTREYEIFRLLVSGRPASEIARVLNLSAKTVANYHTLIKQKLHSASDVELVLLALRHKLL
ncbi:MAG TPA: response regulator transcription factor [Steroidobacteraceae bacterium]|jgi:DNA-binding NarL/FixJ family response regulator